VNQRTLNKASNQSTLRLRLLANERSIGSYVPGYRRSVLLELDEVKRRVGRDIVAWIEASKAEFE
jgi:hypothetical protein